MRIKDIDGETLAQVSRDVRVQRWPRAAVGTDGVQVFRVKLEAAIDKHDATFLRRVQNHIYAEIPVRISRVQFLADGRQSSQPVQIGEDMPLHHFQRVSSNGGDADVDKYNRFWSTSGSNTFQNLRAFATSDGEIRLSNNLYDGSSENE